MFVCAFVPVLYCRSLQTLLQPDRAIYAASLLLSQEQQQRIPMFEAIYGRYTALQAAVDQSCQFAEHQFLVRKRRGGSFSHTPAMPHITLLLLPASCSVCCCRCCAAPTVAGVVQRLLLPALCSLCCCRRCAASAIDIVHMTSSLTAPPCDTPSIDVTFCPTTIPH